MKLLNAPFEELLAAMMFHTGQPEIEISLEDMIQFRSTLGPGAGVTVEFEDGVTKLALASTAERTAWREGQVKGGK